MKFIIQTVSEASIICQSNQSTQKINRWCIIYIGIGQKDINLTDQDIVTIINNVITLKCIEDNTQKINASIQETWCDVLLISNFTLYANHKKGKKLDFWQSARFHDAQSIYYRFLDCFQKTHIACIAGVFGDYMTIQSTVIWPINIILEY
jgi:D-tyrosyl-tRNA(Tyr) deacylase